MQLGEPSLNLFEAGFVAKDLFILGLFGFVGQHHIGGLQRARREHQQTQTAQQRHKLKKSNLVGHGVRIFDFELGVGSEQLIQARIEADDLAEHGKIRCVLSECSQRQGGGEHEFTHKGECIPQTGV